MAIKLSVLFLVSIVLINGEPPCRFSSLFTTDQLLHNKTARDEFVFNVLHWEGYFHSDGAGLNAATGLTYDGHGIDYTTGRLADPLHYWSAPSKESIHLGLLARALAQGPEDPDVREFFHVPLPKHVSSRWNTGDSRLDVVLTMIERKISSYEKWNSTYPGFGGFIPWVYVNDSGMVPIPPAWTNQVPGLDNGEMIWGMYAVIQALKSNSSYSDLAERYSNYFNYLKSTAKMVFYNGDGMIRSVTKITNPFADPYPSNYAGTGGYLDDPYEGELLTVFMDLYSDFTNEERELLWVKKRALLQSVDFNTPSGKITVQRGWWFSSHEQWKYMMLPYMEVPINRRVFINSERARSWNSALNKYAGMFASVTNVTTPSVSPNYLSATGIQSIAFETVIENDVVTPYAAFPLFLATESHGHVWYNLMLQGPRMQGPYGSTESVNLSGTKISPVITWDSKITTVLAMVGGVYEMNSKGLKAEGKFERFHSVISREWGRVFTVLHGEHLDFMLPTNQIPTNSLGDFTTCTL